LKINFKDITIKNNLYVQAGEIEIFPNKINVITGKNGVGKSLLLSYFHNQLPNSTLISQKNDEIIPTITTLENVSLTIKTKNKVDQVTEWFDMFHLAYLLTSKTKNLSGGEKRIISIIRGLLSDAPLILIDEPTNDLDFEKVAILLDLLINCCDHKTFLIVTHDDRVEKIAHVNYVIENRKIGLSHADTKTSIDPIKAWETSPACDEKSIKTNQEPSFKKILCSALSSLIRALSGFTTFNSKFGANKIEKVFTFNFMMMMLTATAIIYSHGMIQEANAHYVMQFDEINENQIDIMSPMTVRQDSLVTALPISFIEFIQTSALIPSRDEIEAYVDRIIHMPFTFTLELPPSDDFEKFVLEYRKINEGRFLQPLEIYATDILGYEVGSVFIDSSTIFTDDFNFNNGMEAYVMEPALYFEATSLLRERYNSRNDPLRATYIVLILSEEIDFWQFLESRYIQRISGGNYWIRSNEIISILNQVLIFSSHDTLLNQSLTIGLFLFMGNTFSSLLYSIVNRKKMTILRHYGFDYSEVRVKILKKLNSRIILLLLVMTILFGNTFFLIGTPLYQTFVGYAPALSMIAALIMSQLMNRILIYFNLKSIYRWESR